MAEKKKVSSGFQICENTSFVIKEAFKRLRTNLLLALPESDEKKCNVIGITSAQPSEGKSTVAINTAYSLAELGEQVLLIDADMRRPSIHAKLDMPVEAGLSDLLMNSNNISGIIKQYKGSSKGVGFDVITSGGFPDNPSEMLTSARMKKLLEALSEVYRYIILDLPPIGAVSDAIVVGKSKMDGVIVVVRENKCPADTFDECIEQLRFAQINILGFVVNGSTEKAAKKYKYSKYEY